MQDQHSMADGGVIEKIVSAAEIRPDETVLEIGAGTGPLTREIAKKAGKVLAVEKDRKFENILKDELKEYGNAEIIIGNILKIIDKLKFGKIVSNLPYSICEPLMQKLFHIRFEKAVLTVPETFAKIIMARENEKNYSKLSFLSNIFFDVKKLFEVPRESFQPKPRTKSVAIEIKPKEMKTEAEKILAEIFLDERKKIKNSLREALIKADGLTKRQARERIKSFGIEKTILEKEMKELSLNEMKEAAKKVS